MIISLLICVFTSVLLCAALSGSSSHKTFLIRSSAVQWLALFPFLLFFNEVRPFTDGGDDGAYFSLVISMGSLIEAFDPHSYIGFLEQPGYPMLLAPFSLLSDGNLLALKAVNVACFIILTSVWSRIGFELHGERFGRTVGIFVTLLLPLWYYAFFLLKDMPIAMLQGVAILGGVLICNRKLALGMLLILISTLLLVPLRSFLTLINIAILGISLYGTHYVAAQQRLRRRGRSKILLIGSILLSSAAAYALFSPQLTASLGVVSENRQLSIENILAHAEAREAESLMRRSIFPILYFVSETSGLRALLLGIDGSSESLRGLFAAPWILSFLPFLGVGMYFIWTRLRPSGILASPWLPVVSFCIIYLVVAWSVKDTTRWRLPDFPALATIAALGFSQVQAKSRVIVLLLWPMTILVMGAVFYIFLQ